MSPLTTIPVTIYGYGNDILCLLGPRLSIYGEYNCRNTCIIMLTAPNGETFKVYAAYEASDTCHWTGWEVHPYGDDNAAWKWESAKSPEYHDYPAIIVHVPAGTTVERIDGEE